MKLSEGQKKLLLFNKPAIDEMVNCRIGELKDELVSCEKDHRDVIIGVIKELETFTYLVNKLKTAHETPDKPTTPHGV